VTIAHPINSNRKLAAIFAADIAGYGALINTDEDGTVSKLKLVREAVLPIIENFGGRVIDLAGDGILAEFGSAVHAVEAAIAVQSRMDILNTQSEPEMLFRVGVNIGDVIYDDTRLYGDGINIATRLETLSPEGGICISGKVYEEVKGKISASFRDIGAQQLKNIADPVHVFTFEGEHPAESSMATEIGSVLPLPNKPSIAVLPFANLSGDTEQEYFADGIVEDIIAGLSRFKWLFVIARNSSFIYKGKAVDVKQVGHQLGVRYVLEGSVRKSGSRIRITTQLIQADTAANLWAERYDRLLDDVFAVQDDITTSVVGAIEPSLRKVEIERVKRKRPENLDAYDLVLRAMPFVYRLMPEGANAAIPLLREALRLEPDYVAAHAFLAWCYHFRFSRGGRQEDDRARAIYHARAATSRGVDDATALAISGLVIWFCDHGDTGAFELFDRALALSGSNIFALSCSTVPLAWTGNTSLAIERAQRALRLSPFDSLNYLPYDALSISHFQLQDYEAAYDAAKRAAESNPHFSVPHALMAAALLRLGRRDAAELAAQRLLTLDPTFSPQRFSAIVGHMPEVFVRFVEAWHEVGLKE
jgi:adenylate cyclase